MIEGFWKNLKKPFFVLAPMADVTDAAFRRVIAKYGKPDVMWTEFVSADGLIKATEIGKKKLLKDLLYSESERPIVAQLFTSNPDMMRQAAALVQELGFDGIDINMGCPDRSIEKQGAGAAMMKNPKLAREVIRAAKEGAPNLPVSVKTRLGYNTDELDTWLPELLSEELAAITIHARTRKEMSKVPARWERVKDAVEIRNKLGCKTLIIGNGDVKDLEDAKKKVAESGADGAMLGRAIFGNPWTFSSTVPSIQKKLLAMLEHTNLFEELLGDVKNFAVMKKHYKAYVQGFDGAAELRAKLMETQNAQEVAEILKQ
ncbi:tRNA-dihydrouridine synthase [Candidatus Parcubacteria bacterium]|nr:tRNA-dihydrouridine synthase [Candidatus Parcubacteria bacterium]